MLNNKERINLNKWNQYSEKLRYMFVGIEDGWLECDNEDFELYQAFIKWATKLEEQNKNICEVCGDKFTKSHYSSSKYENICSKQECFSTIFWNNIIAEKEHHVFINGMCYYIDKKDIKSNGNVGGFGGQEFTIQYLDSGNKETTNNLWCQGIVPDKYKDKLKDNAIFIDNKVGNKNG